MDGGGSVIASGNALLRMVFSGPFLYFGAESSFARLVTRKSLFKLGAMPIRPNVDPFLDATHGGQRYGRRPRFEIVAGIPDFTCYGVDRWVAVCVGMIRPTNP
jgi:hypothetical protein